MLKNLQTDKTKQKTIILPSLQETSSFLVQWVIFQHSVHKIVQRFVQKKICFSDLSCIKFRSKLLIFLGTVESILIMFLQFLP